MGRFFSACIDAITRRSGGLGILGLIVPIYLEDTGFVGGPFVVTLCWSLTGFSHLYSYRDMSIIPSYLFLS